MATVHLPCIHLGPCVHYNRPVLLQDMGCTNVWKESCMWQFLQPSSSCHMPSSFVQSSLHSPSLEYPDGSDVAVWLYDGSVRYLQGKHIPLFLFAMIVLLSLFLQYTLVLSLGQWVQARSRNRLFSWISDYRVKAFLDAYHGPFKLYL